MNSQYYPIFIILVIISIAFSINISFLHLTKHLYKTAIRSIDCDTCRVKYNRNIIDTVVKL